MPVRYTLNNTSRNYHDGEEYVEWFGTMRGALTQWLWDLSWPTKWRSELCTSKTKLLCGLSCISVQIRVIRKQIYYDFTLWFCVGIQFGGEKKINKRNMLTLCMGQICNSILTLSKNESKPKLRNTLQSCWLPKFEVRGSEKRSWWNENTVKTGVKQAGKPQDHNKNSKAYGSSLGRILCYI